MKSKTCLLAVVLALVDVAAATNKKLARDPQNQRAGGTADVIGRFDTRATTGSTNSTSFAVWGGFAPRGSNRNNGDR